MTTSTHSLPTVKKDHESLILELVNSGLTKIKTALAVGDLQALGIRKGSYAVYDKESFTDQLSGDAESHREYLGRAINFFMLNLREFAMDQVPAMDDIEQSSGDHFNAITVMNAGKKEFVWGNSVPIILKSDFDVSRGIGSLGHISLKKAGMDKQTYGFLHGWIQHCDLKPTKEITADMIKEGHEMYRAAATHMPCDIYYSKSATDEERMTWLKSFQLMEDLSKNAAEFGFSAWDICVQYTHLQSLNKKVTGNDSVEGVDAFLQKVDFAPQSEYKASKKPASQALICYKKLKTSDVDWILMGCKAQFRGQGPLCKISFITKMCQRCADDDKKLAWLVKLTYMRLCDGTLSIDVSRTDFDKEVILPAFEMYDVHLAVPQVFGPKIGAQSKDVEWLTQAATDPFFLNLKLNDTDEKLKVTSMKPSTKHLLKFMDGSYKNGYNRVYVEMVTNCKKQSPAMKLSYSKLMVQDVVDGLIEKEVVDAKKRQSLSDTIAQMSAPLASNAVDESSSDEDEAAAAARTKQEAQSKEDQIAAALTQHIGSVIDDNFATGIRPSTTSAMDTLLETHDFIVNRHHVDGNCMFHWDCGADKDSVAGDRQSPFNVLPVLDQPAAEAFIKTVDAKCLITGADFLNVSDGKNPANSSKCAKLCARTQGNREDYQIQYNQSSAMALIGKGAGRSKLRLRERTFYTSIKPVPLNPDERIYYRITDCMADCIAQADCYDEKVEVKKEDKEHILGISNMSVKEQMLAADATVSLFTHEKDPRVVEEIMHQVHAKKVVSATPGLISLSIACINQDATALLLFRNEDHKTLWRSKFADWLRLECSTNRRCRWYFPRAEIIRRLQLQDDTFEPDSVAVVAVDENASSGNALPEPVDTPKSTPKCRAKRRSKAAPAAGPPVPEPGNDRALFGDSPIYDGITAEEEGDDDVDPLDELFGGPEAEEAVVPAPKTKRRKTAGAGRGRGRSSGGASAAAAPNLG